MRYRILYQISLIVAFFFIYQNSMAQPSYIGLNLRNIYFLKDKVVYNGATERDVIDYNLMPTITYAHYLKNNIGVSLEFGHTIQKTLSKSFYDDTAYYFDSRLEYKRKMFHLSLSLFEDYYWRKYYFIIGINFDWNHEYQYDAFLNDTTYNKSMKIGTKKNGSRVYPNSNILGLYIQPAAYRKIYNNFYAGVRLQSGIQYLNINGKLIETTSQPSQQDDISVVNLHETNLNTDLFRFHVSLIYQFNNKKQKQD